MATSEELISALITEASGLTQAIKTYKTGIDAKVNTAVAEMKVTTDQRVAAAIDAITKVANIIDVYVDSTAGLDTNAGTQLAPVKTIKRALSFSVLHKTIKIWLKVGMTHVVEGRLDITADTAFNVYGGPFVRWSDTVLAGGPGGATGVIENHPTIATAFATLEFKSFKDLTKFTTDYPDVTAVTSAILGGYSANFKATHAAKAITVTFNTLIIKCLDWGGAGVPPEYFTRTSLAKGGLLGRQDASGPVNLLIGNCAIWMRQNPLITIASGMQEVSVESYNALFIFEKSWKLDKVAEGMYLIDNEGGHPVRFYGSNSYYFTDGTVITDKPQTRILARPSWYTYIVSGITISKSVDAYNIVGNVVTNMDYIAAGNAGIDALRIV